MDRIWKLINTDLPAWGRGFNGPDATTGLTAKEMVTLVDHSTAPDWAKVAAISLCRAYAINGAADFAHVANVIAKAYSHRDDN